ncbi:MAG: DoxX family protein [Acidobacteriota bacterium]
MVPLIVMLAAWMAFRLCGWAGLLSSADSGAGSLRLALAAMFVFTALSHFLPRSRQDLIAMVPPAFPRPDVLVRLTGILELAGAFGLLLPGLVRTAACCLAVLLVAMFPANVHAARKGLRIAGRPATPLALRLPMQLFWILALGWVALTASTSKGG